MPRIGNSESFKMLRVLRSDLAAVRNLAVKSLA